MRDVLGTFVGYAMLAPFAHVVAAIALAPLLHFSKVENRSPKGIAIGVAICCIWWAMCLGTVEFSQFAIAAAPAGLFAGAAVNVVFLGLKYVRDESYRPSTAATWVAVYLMPGLGWVLATRLLP